MHMALPVGCEDLVPQRAASRYQPYLMSATGAAHPRVRANQALLQRSAHTAATVDWPKLQHSGSHAETMAARLSRTWR